MAVNKINPKTIFASEAPTQDTPAVFTNKTVGWGESRKNGGRPTIKQMNALQQETDLKILWLNENAVTPYDATIDYPINAVTIKDGTFKIFNGTSWSNFLDKSSVGLSNVDNTSDLNKPISTAVKTKLDYIDKNGAALPYNPALTYLEGAVVVKDGELQQWQGGVWVNISSQEVKKYLLAAGVDESELDGDYDFLMQRLAQIAVDKGWDASFVVDGDKTQHEINVEQASLNDTYGQEINNLKSTFVTPEMFGAVANSWETDNTAALNAAFATGKDVYSTPDKIYTCNGNLRTQGQRCVGGWKIRSSKNVVGGSWLNTSNTYATPCDYTYLQGVYCAYAYDLAELFAIRDLGYNTLLHYGGMHINSYDDDGTVTNLLDNAKTAGLQVFLGTQNSLNGMSLTDFVNAHKNHPAVLGFLIADEPTHNGITVAQQEVTIATVKALTNKPVAVSDFTFDAFTEVLADGYDYIFGDIYNDAGSTKEQTLYKMRAWLGLTTKRHPNAKVLPAVMGFKYRTGAPLADIIETSKIFAKACGGNFACFIWDGLGDAVIENSIRDTASLQGLSREICAYKTNVYRIPKCYAWGTLFSQPTQTPYGLKDVLEHFVRSDPNYSTGFEGVNCYPAQMNEGAVESERVTPHMIGAQAIAGIWFKGTYGAYISDIKMNRYNHFTVQSGMLNRGGASVELSVRGSQTGGYGVGAVLATLPINLSVTTVNFENLDPRDMFCIKYDSSLNAPYYRTFVRGVYITSDW